MSSDRGSPTGALVAPARPAAQGIRRAAGWATRGAGPGLARIGLLARAVFYLMLGYLAVRVAMLGGSPGAQPDANGALALITRSWPGEVGVAVAAVGFLLFGLVRTAAAIRDRRPAWWQRGSTALQGIFYLALTYVPVSYLAGNRSAGSQQSQTRETAALLGLPGGQVLVVAVGVLVVGVCAWQIRTAVSQDWAEGMDVGAAPGWIRALVRVAGTLGIAARAAVFLPIGVFLAAAGIDFSPGHSYGLDEELLHLSGHEWGVAVLAAVAAGLFVFAGYTVLEARYRNLTEAD